MAFAMASYCRAWPLLRRGQINDAVADAQAAVDARADGWAAFLPMATSCLALAQLERGANAEARGALASLEDYEGLERSSQYPMVLIARGRLLTAEGDFEPAISTLRSAGELLADIGFDSPTLFPWRIAAVQAATLAGKQDEARVLAEAAMGAADRARVPATVARAHRAAASAAGGEEAVEYLRRGLAIADGLPPRLERIYLLLDLGAALRRRHRRAEAVEALHTALALASQGGAGALAGRARAELAVAGARVNREPTQDGLESLTPSERRVAELAAAGHTNREIAQLLFVTVKTVEYHLGNAYRKLGINRRAQLAPLLDGEPTA